MRMFDLTNLPSIHRTDDKHTTNFNNRDNNTDF